MRAPFALLVLSSIFLGAAESSLESGFRDALGLARSKVIDKVLPETAGVKCYREAMKLRYNQPLDSDKAFKLFKEGADAGHAGCAYELSVCFLNGVGTRKSQSAALDILKKGMQMSEGSPIECELKWISLHLGSPVSLYNETTARGYLLRLQELAPSNPAAAAMITRVNWVDGTPPTEMVSVHNHFKAVENLKSQAKSGDAYACFEYGKILMGSGHVRDEASPKFVKKDTDQGLRLIELAASKNIQGAHYWLYEYYNGTDTKPSVAYEWLEKGWAAGDCDSGYALSRALTRGSGTAVDKKRAVDVALKVGEQGDARQTYNIADFFTGYTGLDPSLEMFILMHRISADKGNVDSCDELGRIYSGEEVIRFKVNYPISVDEALKYFKRGAYPDGEYNHVYRLSCLLYLGDMYRRGIACEADPEMAAKVYLDYLEAFRKIDFSGNTVFANGGKVRMLWLKSHYPDLAGVPELNDPRLRFDGVVDYMHSFKHFGRVDFDYELFDEIAKIVSTRGKNEKDNFQRACTYVVREFGARDCLFHFVNLEYGEEFNSYSYEAYKDAALSGSATAAFRLHDMLFRESSKPGTLNAGPECALRLSMGRNNHELVIAYGETEAWRRFGISQDSMLNAGRSLKRDCGKVAAPFRLYVKVKDDDEASHVLPILRKINEIYRERLAKEATSR
jgi:TPR repeat protein